MLDEGLAARAPQAHAAPTRVRRLPAQVDADYSDLPEHLRYKKKMADEEHKAKKKLEEEANECALCGKDVRFFCDCRSGDKVRR